MEELAVVGFLDNIVDKFRSSSGKQDSFRYDVV